MVDTVTYGTDLKLYEVFEAFHYRIFLCQEMKLIVPVAIARYFEFVSKLYLTIALYIG